MYKLVLILAFISTAFASFGQTGKIRGSVYEAATGEPLIGVTVVIKGTTKGAVTDFDGKFEINVEPGKYDVQISFVSFETITISGVEVQNGDVTVLDNIQLKEAVEELQEVVVTAEVIRDSESALITVKRKSANLLDGISAAKFRKIGDGDAAAAVKRVTGVSVEGGKYVYIRGLGDRYTKTTLNNVDIPGLDPDRNSLQIDIFPTNLIDNMLVMKSSLAEMPADFTGGVVNIETKDFPEEKILDVSASVGYNPSMHFNSDYIKQKGSDTDFLGFDNGLRALPDNARGSEIPSPVTGNFSDSEINSFVKSFNPNLGATNSTSFMDYSLGLTYGNQLNLGGDKKLGLIFSLTYKNSTKFYDDVRYDEYQRSTQSDEMELIPAVLQSGIQGENSVLVGGLAGVALKTLRSKIKLTALHLQNGEARTAQLNISDDPTSGAVGKSGFIGFANSMDYSERGLTNILLNGQHYLGSNQNWEVDWRVSPTFSKINDPDIRRTAFTYIGTDTTFNAGAGGNPTRAWRFLEEFNLMNRADITRNYKLFNEDAKLKFGASYTYKNRDFEILQYDLQFFGSQPEYQSNPDNVLLDKNIYPDGTIYFSSGNAELNPNAFNSNNRNIAFYISNEFNPTEKLKAILGLRVEDFEQRYTGNNQGATIVFDDQKVLDATDLFPSGNLVYSINDDQNLRVSYSRTIARPSFKEASYAQILDPISNRLFNGALYKYSDWDGKITETRINNFDLRWEHFIKRGQLVSLSAFYKTFDNPIELVRIPEQQTITELQPRNVGDGQVFGAEIEIRKSLDFISMALDRFSFSGNLTLVKSELQMSETEYDARLQYIKDGQNLDNKREMAGQAPYIVNAGFAYENSDIGLDAGVYYNVQGETLYIVGTGLYSDVYTEPFHSLKFNLNKSFGPDKRSSVNLSFTNLLNDSREWFYQSYGAADQYYERRSPGTSISVGLKYSF